jgi:hypothetical protein
MQMQTSRTRAGGQESETAERVPLWRFDLCAMEADVRERLTRWRSMLIPHLADARQLLRKH